GTGFLHVAADRDDLLAAFDRARAAHQNDLRTADFDIADVDRSAHSAELMGHELIGLEDGGDRLDAGNGGKRLLTNHVFRSDHADNDADSTATQLGAETPLMDTIDDMLNLIVGRIGFGDNDHSGMAKGNEGTHPALKGNAFFAFSPQIF